MTGLHVLACDTRDATLAVRREDGSLAELALDGAFRWSLSDVRRCVGRLEDGRHEPCPTQEPLSLHAQCARCSGLEDPACVFEPRCALDPAACHCVSTFRGVPHVVYCAFFATLPKVGLTQERRLAARLREQGADAGFVVQRHVRGRPDAILGRAEARQAERTVSWLHGMPEHRSHRETLPQLARPVPWPEIEARAREWMDRLAPGFDVEARLLRVEGHRLRQPLPAPPRRAPAAGRHAGTWVGAKGPHLVYQAAAGPDRLPAGPRLVALKAPDLVGRQLTVAG